ncbi:signal transduction histidine kinase [Rhodoblastus sphagnicola]|nr:ATP-binding protein [Rhodoblastus sphagnicola]MBB4198930.1 signal transduction histidine kinase [Rhodoblastus sphagnicola]
MRRNRKEILSISTLIATAASLILIAIVYGAYVFSERSGALSQSAFDVSFSELRLSRAFNILLEAESSQRGFLLTHDASYLQPFLTYRQRAGAELDHAEEQMKQLDMVGSAPALAQLREVIEAKLTELDQTVAMGAAGEMDQARAVVRGNVGRDLMSQARDIVSDKLRQLANLRAERVADAQANAARLTTLTTIGVFSVVLLSLVGVAQVYSYSADLAGAQDKLATINDALERRVAERTRSLQTANEEIQRYAYIVSHDLRAPLVNIIGFAKELAASVKSIAPALDLPSPAGDGPVIAQARLAVKEDIPEALKFIDASTTRMDNLINAILSLSRLGRLPLLPQDIDLAALTERCVASLQHRLNDAGARVAIEGRLPRMIGDQQALEQIIGNLLDNAAKYLAPERSGRLLVRGRRAGPQVVIEVEDNGRGVAPGDHERIFELFRRAGKQDRAGDGIGLAHVRSLVRRLGGEIAVTSDGESGCTFTVTLPADLRRAMAEGYVNA